MFATMLLLDDQVTGRSVTTVPLISVTRAVRMRVSPTRRLELTGSMTTLATIAAGTGTTLTAAVPASIPAAPPWIQVLNGGSYHLAMVVAAAP